MNYKQIVENFKQLVFDHRILQDFGYGDLTDIKVGAEDSQGLGDADYPYAFLNPSGVTVDGSSRIYNFNLIVMEMVSKPSEVLTVQSNCIQYVDDLISKFNYINREEDITLQYGITTFKERFQDEVAGATANLQIRAKVSVDACATPYGDIVPPTPEGQFVLDARTTYRQLFRPDVNPGGIGLSNIVLDTYAGMRPDEPYNYYTIKENGTWTFVLEGQATRQTDNNSWPTGFNLISQQGGVNLEADISNWPTVPPVVGETFSFRLQWSDVPLTVQNGFLSFTLPDEPPVEDWVWIEIGTQLTGYHTPTV